MTNPTVSVVIPAYNHAPFVAESIRSVLDQSFADVELCITDDASPDGTADVIRQFTDPRVHFEGFSENRGAAVALNSAIRRSRGEFVCYLSSDDYFLPGKIASQAAFLRANPDVAAVFGLPRFIDERGEPLANEANPNAAVFEAPFRNELRSRAAWLRWFYFNANCLCHPTAMIRRSVFDDVGLFEPCLANLPDFDMWVRLCAKHEIRVVPEQVTAMRILDDARNMSAPRRDSQIRTLSEYYFVLKRFLTLDLHLLHQIFAQELADHPEWSKLPPDRLLVEAALTAAHPSHKFFAVDTLLGAAASDSPDHRRAFEITGSVDLFALGVTEAFQAELANLHSELAASEQRAHAIRNDAHQIDQTLRSEIDKLHAELAASEKRAHAIRNDAHQMDQTLRGQIARLQTVVDSRQATLAGQQVLIRDHQAAQAAVTRAIADLRRRSAEGIVNLEDIDRLEQIIGRGPPMAAAK